MKKLHFSTTISAPREKVWDILWNESTYGKWTEPFAQGGSMKTNWEAGGRVLFLDGSGKEGMVSEIAVKKLHEQLFFRHLGWIKDGVEDLDSPEIKAWAGAMENYTLKSENGHTLLEVDMDITEEHEKSFGDLFPKALAIVKSLAEEK